MQIIWQGQLNIYDENSQHIVIIRPNIRWNTVKCDYSTNKFANETNLFNVFEL